MDDRSPQHIARAQYLMSLSRYGDAISEIQQHLAQEPDDAWAHSMMAAAYVLTGKNSDAVVWADRGIQLGPNIAYCHYVKALVYRAQRKYKEAEAAALESLRLDPFAPDYYAMLGQIRLEQQNWQGAVDAAESGLALNAAHSSCINVRAFALLRQGKKDHADAAVQAALANNPEDAFTHANQGWICLGRGELDRALTHFKEAIRLDPNSDSARRGILEALANKYFVYRCLYRYFEWMASFNVRVRQGIVIGGYLLYRGLLYAASGPVKWSLFGIYGFFVWLTWTGRSPFDLLLRLNPLGRLALNRKQIIASNWIGLCLLGALISLCLGFAHGMGSPLLAAICFVFLAIPGAKIARANGDIRIANAACILVYLAISGLEAAGWVTRDTVAWPASALIALIWVGVIYTWIVGIFVRS